MKWICHIRAGQVFHFILTPVATFRLWDQNGGGYAITIMAFQIRNVCNKPSQGQPLEGFEGEFQKSWSVFTTLLAIAAYLIILSR